MNENSTDLGVSRRAECESEFDINHELHVSSVDRVCVTKSNFLKVTACDSVKNVFSMVDLVG